MQLVQQDYRPLEQSFVEISRGGWHSMESSIVVPVLEEVVD